jgi:hypothetical protein
VAIITSLGSARYRGDWAAAFSMVETGSGTAASMFFATVPLWQLSDSMKMRTPGANLPHRAYSSSSTICRS